MGTGITEATLRRLLDVISPDHDLPQDAGLPEDVLRGLAELIPCAGMSLFTLDTTTARTLEMQSLDFRPFPSDTADTDELFREAFWECVACSRPTEMSGMSVTTWQDFYTERSFEQLLMAEYCRVMTFWHELLLCLPSAPGTSRRLLLVRDRSDVPFSERDRLLLTLLRPHLSELLIRADLAAQVVPALTSRQVELLRYVAAGLSNHQISRRLGVSDGTVRKHLENIYARLDAHSRTEAVARAAPLLARG
jgi:DNA-binding CsgD family transcriptional regulator